MTDIEQAKHYLACAQVALNMERSLGQDCGFSWYLQLGYYYLQRAQKEKSP